MEKKIKVHVTRAADPEVEEFQPDWIMSDPSEAVVAVQVLFPDWIEIFIEREK